MKLKAMMNADDKNLAFLGPQAGSALLEDSISSSQKNSVPAQIQYSKEEISLKFEALLASINIKNEIASIDSKFRFFLRKKRIYQEFTATSIALWGLALEQSFPNQYMEFYNYFMEKSPVLGVAEERAIMVKKTEEYVKLLAEKKLEDFTPLSQYLSQFFNTKKDPKKVLLKISLATRRLYKNIFEYLL